MVAYSNSGEGYEEPFYGVPCFLTPLRKKDKENIIKGDLTPDGDNNADIKGK